MNIPETNKNLTMVYLDRVRLAEMLGKVHISTMKKDGSKQKIGAKYIIAAEDEYSKSTEVTEKHLLTDAEAYAAIVKLVESSALHYYHGQLQLDEKTNELIDYAFGDEKRFSVDQDCSDFLKKKGGGTHLSRDIFVFGYLGDDDAQGENEGMIRVVAMYRKDRVAPNQEEPGSARVIPLDVMGLDELLFPDMDASRRGFELPRENKIIPKVYIIKGAPGTGKTILAIQMLMGFVKSKQPISCLYCHTEPNRNAIKETAISFAFSVKETLTTKNFDKKITLLRERCQQENDANKRAELEEKISQLKDNIRQELENENRSLFEKAVSEEKISFLAVDQNYNVLLNQKDLEKEFSKHNVVFFDSLNVPLIAKHQKIGLLGGKEEPVRDVLHRMIAPHKKANRLVFFLLEDYGAEATDEVRQHIADCEFLADAVIQLSEKDRNDYRTWSLKIKKKHYGSQIYGNHIYKICTPNHALSNIFKEHSGIVVFPSIHRYLSGAREAFDSYDNRKFIKTGITHLDAIFKGDTAKPEDAGKSMPPDATIVIRGIKGSHKLPLGINILLGGLWSASKNGHGYLDQSPSDVLIILLDEESNINLNRTAIAGDTELLTKMELPKEIESLDNAFWLRPGPKNCNNRSECHWRELCDNEKNNGKKVFFRKTCFASKSSESGEDCRKAVIAGFRPGCITPEEFLNIVKKLIRPTNDSPAVFSRVLFISTAHLRMRFPLLDSDKLFLPALIDVFKSQRVLSIIIDIEGDGANKEMSYGLSSLADYLITLKPMNDKYRSEFEPNASQTSSRAQLLIKNLGEEYKTGREGFAWSEMDVENVRGKEYSKSTHAVTVMPSNNSPWQHHLHILNLKRKVSEQRKYIRNSADDLELTDASGNRIPMTCINFSTQGLFVQHSDPELLRGISNVFYKKGMVKGGPLALSTRWTRTVKRNYETGFEIVQGALDIHSKAS